MPDPNHPKEEINPRDPKGAVGSTLNPLRDHVQGEPEGDAKSEAAPKPAPPSPPQQQAKPAQQPPHHDDKSKR